MLDLSDSPPEKGKQMAAQTKSRAARAADQAAQDQQEQQQPEPAEDEEAEEAEAEETEDQPEPAGPYAQVGTESYPQTFHRPAVKVTSPDGEVIETITTCPHEPDGKNKWGHKDEKAALTCARKIAAQRGLRIGAPKA
jgi:hypothetical protein